MTNPRSSLSAALIAAACGADVTLLPPCDQPEFVFDPFRHEVCMAGCFDAMDCPRGTICAKGPDDPEDTQCLLPTDVQQTSLAALLDGFGVEKMTSALMASVDAHELTWKRPEAAKIVTCALFACPPAFRVAHGDEWLAPSVNRNAIEIANYDRCVIAAEVSTSPEGAFNLRTRENSYAPSDAPPRGPDCKSRDGRCAPITELLAGCWAYDDTRVIAATRLAAIDIGEGIYDYHGLIATGPGASCSAELEPGDREHEFRICVLDASEVEEVPASASTETGYPATGTDTSMSTDESTSAAEDSTGEVAAPADPAAPAKTAYGVCHCGDAGPPCDDPCKRPCLSHADCGANPEDPENQTVIPIGYCQAETCTRFF